MSNYDCIVKLDSNKVSVGTNLIKNAEFLFQVAAYKFKPEVTVRRFVIGSQFESRHGFVDVTGDVVIFQNGNPEIFGIRYRCSPRRADLLT
jgi:hypothetical protein